MQLVRDTFGSLYALLQRNKALRLLIYILVIYFVMKGLGLFAVKKIIEGQWAKFSDTELSIGSLSYSLSGRSLSVRDVRLSDGEIPIFELGQFKLGVDVLSLLSDTAVIRYIDIDYPTLTYSKKGKTSNLAKLFGRPTRAVASKPERAKKPTSKKEKKIISFKLKELNVEGCRVSYSEQFDKDQFLYVIDDGDLVIRNFGYPHIEKSSVEMSMRFPTGANASFQGYITPYQKKKFRLKGNLKLDKASIVAVEGFMKNHFGLIPTQGTASLSSDIDIRGMELRSSHTLDVSKLGLKGDSTVTGVVLGFAGSFLTEFMKASGQETLNLKFRLDGDLKGGKTDWVVAFANAIGSAFYAKAGQLERDPAAKMKETTDKVIKSIEDLIP